MNIWGMPVPWPQTPVNQSYCHAQGNWTLFSLLQYRKHRHVPPEPEHPCAAQDSELSQARRRRQAAGAPRGRRETNTSGTVQQVSVCVSQCKRVLGPLWPLHSSDLSSVGGCLGQEPSLPAAPIEAEAVGTGSTLSSSAAGQETLRRSRSLGSPQLRRWRLSRPGRPRGSEAPRWGHRRASVWPLTSKLQAFLGVFLKPPPTLPLFMPMGSIPIGIWGLPGHLEETGDQAPAWPAAPSGPPGRGWCRARGQGDLLEGGHRAPRFRLERGTEQLGGRQWAVDGRGRLQSRALGEREGEWVEWEVQRRSQQHCPIPARGTNSVPNLYLQRKRKQLLPQALWYKGP